MHGVQLVLLVCASSAFAQIDGGTPSAEEMKEIERALQADAQDKERPKPSGAGPLQSFNPELSFIADVALAAFSSEEPLQTGGHDPRNTGFTLQQLEMSARASVDPYFRFDSNIVFSPFGVEIEEAYATTTSLPASLQIRAGQFLTRFGRINSTHLHAWDFVDQPFPIGRVFGGEGNRGLGFELSYLTPLPWYVELVGSVTDATGESTAKSFFGATPARIQSPWDFQYTGAVKQFFALSDDWSLLWGLSLATGPNPTGRGNRTDIWGTDLYVKFRPLSGGRFTVVSLQAEALYRRRQVPDDSLQDTGLYANLLWRFFPRWAAAARYEFGNAVTNIAGQRVEDALNPEWQSDRHRFSLNTTFWPTEFSRIRLQGSMDLPGWEPVPSFALFLALEVVIGAHGAHAF